MATPRRIINGEKALDMLASMTGGQMATICYVNTIPIVDDYIYMDTNPSTNKKTKYVNYNWIATELGSKRICFFISVTTYTLQFYTQDTMRKKYPEWKEKVNQVRNEFGLGPMGSRRGYQQRMDYGHGIATYKGYSKDKEGRVYTNQNTFKCLQKTKYYGFDFHGNMVKEFDEATMAKYLIPKGRNAQGLKELEAVEHDAKRIGDYINRIMNLGMEYTTFILDKIVYMVGSDAQGKFFFVNDNLTDIIDDINTNVKWRINPKEILKMVKEKFGEDYALIESKERQRLVEEKVDSIIKNVMRNIIL